MNPAMKKLKCANHICHALQEKQGKVKKMISLCVCVCVVSLTLLCNPIHKNTACTPHNIYTQYVGAFVLALVVKGCSLAFPQFYEYCLAKSI